MLRDRPVVLAGTDFGGAQRLAALFAALAAEITGRFAGMLALARITTNDTRCASKISTILVYKVDRLTRSLGSGLLATRHRSRGIAGFETTRHRCRGQGARCPGGRDVWRQSGITYSSGPALAIVNNTPDQQTHVFFGNVDLYEAIGSSSAWGGTAEGNPVDISALAGSPSLGADATAFYWPDDNTEHVFSVDGNGLVRELWSTFDFGGEQQGIFQWSAHDVLNQVAVTAPEPSGTRDFVPIAPPTMSAYGSGSVAAGYVFPDDTKNIAYVDADGINIHLCSHKLGGVWSISHISAAAILSPAKIEAGPT